MVTEKSSKLLNQRNNKWKCQKIEELESVQPAQLNIYQSNTYKKEKTQASHISTMSQEFKKSSDWRTNNPRYSFLQLI